LRNQKLLTWLLGLLTVLAGAAVLWLFWRVVRALSPVATVSAAGALLAILLQPLADRLQRAIRVRAVAALAVVLLVLTPFVVLTAWLVTTVLGEAQGLLNRLPAQLAYASALLRQWQDGLTRLGLHVDLVGQLAAASGAVLRHSITLLSGAATVTADTVITLIVAFFLIWDGAAIVRATTNLLPRSWRPVVTDVGRVLAAAVGGYIRGQVLVAVVFGVIIGVSMGFLGLPDPVLLGFLAGLFELLPTVGPILAGVGPVGLALAQPFPHVLWVLLVFIGAQQLESNVLVPRISGGAVGLHPLTVILAVFGGWSLAGLAGAFLAVPIVAVARELLRRWWQPAIPPGAAARWPAPTVSPAAHTPAMEGNPSGAAPPGPANPLRPAEPVVGPVPAQPPPPPAAVPTGRAPRGARRRAGPP
jgi:predicted PurR-regulated permease PerM